MGKKKNRKKEISTIVKNIMSITNQGLSTCAGENNTSEWKKKRKIHPQLISGLGMGDQ
jgi:hypothetical protein